MLASSAIRTSLVLLILRLASPVFAVCNSTQSPITDAQGLSALTGCTVIPGDLTIGYRDCQIPCTIENLLDLSHIMEIQGSLEVLCCSQLADLTGLNSLRSITGSIVVYYNLNLQTITGFDALGTIGASLEVSQNRNLAAISGFQTLTNIGGYLLLERNTALTNIDGFMNLETIRGADLLAGHALNLLYNTALTELRGFRNLDTIVYGTVHIEGNTKLCYAGYPQWDGEGSYPDRLPVGSGDMGIDWRTKLNSSFQWQYTWGVEGAGYPTLVIQNNADSSSCADASCHFGCDEGEGCLGPATDNDLCGTCFPNDDTCVIGPTPTIQSCDPTTIPYWPPDEFPYSLVFGVFFTFMAILALALIALSVFAGIKVYMKFKKSRKGSFDVNLEEESTDSGVSLVPREDLGRLPSASFSSSSRHGSRTRTASYLAKAVQDVGSSLDEVVGASYREKTDTTSFATPPSSSTSSPSSPSSPSPSPTSSSPSSPSPSSPSPSSSSSTTEASIVPKTKTALQRPAPPARAASSTKPEAAGVPMKFPRDQLKLTKEYGTGDFGKVYQAEAKKLVPGVKKTTVVVKQLKDGATEQEKAVFLRPVEAMKALQNPNVVSLMGVCSEGPNIMVILEYSAQGNFKTYLVRKRSEAASIKQSGLLLRMASDMAAGLKYLHSMHIAHNDFAARSCLVMANGTVKIGDYGISRQTFKEDYYARSPDQKAWPVRWMAPETIVLRGRDILESMPASMAGNIWSFGVALWEVCSFAQWPYDDLTNEEVIVTLKSSEKCSLENPLRPGENLLPLYDVMQLCWKTPDQRPSMIQICDTLEELQGNNRKKPILKQDKPVTKQDKPVQKAPSPPPPPTQGRTSSTGQYKPRRPAPRKPPTRTAPTKPMKPKRDYETSNEPLLGSLSLSLESEASQSEEGSRSTTSLKLYPTAKKDQNLKRERSQSNEVLQSSSDGGKPAMGKLNPFFLEHEQEQWREKERRKVGREAQVVREAATGLVFENVGAEGSGGSSGGGGWEGEDEGSKRDSFILEPPVDFSQKDEEEDEEEGRLEFILPEHDGATLTYDFGPEYGEGLEDSPMMERRSGLQTPDPGTYGGKEEGKADWKKRLSETSNPMWLTDDNQFDEFDRRDALEEDDIPNPVYDDDVSELLW